MDRKHKTVIFIIILITVSSLAYFKTTNYNVQTSMITRTINDNFQTSVVSRVIDGDTLELVNGNKVRLLGINTPEHGQFYFEEASDALKELVENKSVDLVKDIDNNDRYGRLLRYVFIGNIFINEQMLKNGYATLYIVNPKEKYSKLLAGAENQAIENGIGLWKQSKYFSCVKLTDFVYKEINKNPNGEHFTLENVCSYVLNMSGWTVKDEARHTYTFKINLSPKSTITLNTGIGKSNQTYIFWGMKSPVWNNAGDTLYLRDDIGHLVLHYKLS
ncbi:MAG TPA: thermonuclease family protein [archaeon]|nr:thermonuclease family protein [archaeon]